MFFSLPRRIRHPFYPGLKSTPARGASGDCAVLTGKVEDLLEAAARGIRPRRAVWVLQPIGETERAALWSIFEVPVLALLVGSGGAAIAYECEAQDGLHVPSRDTRDLPAECPCGRPGPRIPANAFLS